MRREGTRVKEEESEREEARRRGNPSIWKRFCFVYVNVQKVLRSREFGRWSNWLEDNRRGGGKMEGRGRDGGKSEAGKL